MAPGAIVSVGLVTALAATDGLDLDQIMTEVVDASVPMSSADVLSVALGEAVAGVIGAALTYVLNVRFLQRASARTSRSSSTKLDALFSEAVADGDYFVARAAALPLLDAMGLPPFLATLGSVVIAFLPYELVKLVSARRVLAQEEAGLLQELLHEQQQGKARPTSWGTTSQWMPPFSFMIKKPPAVVDTSTLVPVGLQDQPADVVQSFADLIKWLEFDALRENSDNMLFPWNLSPGLEGALFGSLAATSSQLYADALSIYFGFGSNKRKQAVTSRTRQEWFNLYTQQSLSAAALFGVYSAVQYPIKWAILSLISGGVDGCLGSEEFDLCMQVFEVYNPPTATWDAELRGLATEAVSLYSRFFASAPM